MSTIAGHSFDGPWGRCSCGKVLADVAPAGLSIEYIGQHGWAHSGQLVAYEQLEIRAEVERVWSLVQAAATGSGPVASISAEPTNDETTAAEAA